MAKEITIMLKPASSLCNMRCRYCFYADVSERRETKSFGMMKQETVCAILEHVFSPLTEGDRVCFAFQGGEPTLAGLAFFSNFVKEADRRKAGVQVTYTLQTNGLLLDEDWCRFLKQKGFLVGLSLDMLRELHDSNRVDAAYSGTYRAVESARRMLERFDVEYNVLAVLTNMAARHPQQIWNYIKSRGIRYVQFIPCLDGLEAEKKSDVSLSPERFATFYKTLFSLWLKDWDKGSYTSIKLFDDLINLLAEGRQTACGIAGRCSVQLVVEADGSAYPCDFYMLDRYRMGSLAEEGPEEILADGTGARFAAEGHPRHGKCTVCRYGGICGGGCKRMHKNVCIRDGSDYCGYEDFLNFSMNDMLRVARQVRQSRQI